MSYLYVKKQSTYLLKFDQPFKVYSRFWASICLWTSSEYFRLLKAFTCWIQISAFTALSKLVWLIPTILSDLRWPFRIWGSHCCAPYQTHHWNVLSHCWKQRSWGCFEGQSHFVLRNTNQDKKEDHSQTQTLHSDD